MKSSNRAKTQHLYALLILSSCFVFSEFARAVTEPNWNRATAVTAAQSVDSDEVRQGLMDLTIAGSTVELLELLVNTSTRPDWPAPAREAALLSYTQTLGSLPAGTVPREAMTWLKSYQATALVPHEDHVSSGVPLYNVRAAAVGVENGWLRQAALLEGLALLKANPRALVDVFLIETHPAARSGYLDTLAQASQEQLQGVQKSAVRRLKHDSDLTSLAGRAALLTGDLNALADVFSIGSGPALAHLMRDSAAQLGPAYSSQLLRDTIENAPVVNASLAIAELGPVAMREDGAQALLVSQLGHPDLGGSVALALGRSASAELLLQLEALAKSGQPLEASRANMALQLQRQFNTKAVRP